MRLTGKGVEQDQAEAAFWWHLAAETGNAGAVQASKNLRALLKPQEYVRSQRLRARWGSLIADLAGRATGDTSRREIDRALQEAAEKVIWILYCLCWLAVRMPTSQGMQGEML